MGRTRNPFWGNFYVSHSRLSLDTGGPSLTRREFQEECDINTIMKKYEATGVISHFCNGVPQYLDLTGFPDDLMGQMEMLKAAEVAFMTLPAIVRREFDNDPVKFVAFAEDEANVDKMREWGLAKPKELPDAPREEPKES